MQQMKYFALLLLTIYSFDLYSVTSKAVPSSNGFIENKGQIIDQEGRNNTDVRYLLVQSGFNVQIRNGGFSYDTYVTPSFTEKISDRIVRYDRVDIDFVGCNLNSIIVPSEQNNFVYNYFTTGTGTSGVTGVHSFRKIVYENLYPGIDLEYVLDSVGPGDLTGVFKYNFIIHPGANIHNIQMKYSAAGDVRLADNKLWFELSGKPYFEKIPVSYFVCDHKQIPVNYVQVQANLFSFQATIPENFSCDFIIDPIPCLLWGTYYGGQGPIEDCLGLCLDNVNDVLICGYSNAQSNIATSGAYQTSTNGGTDAYIAHLDNSGTSLIWGTFYGGLATDDAVSIGLDSQGNVYITGETYSASGIATSGGYDTSFNGLVDIYVAKFNSTGSALLWSTYYGGPDDDGVFQLELDAAANVYISGFSSSTTGIATAGAYQTTNAGDQDVILAKFDSSGGNILWGTYYGGLNREEGYALAIDNQSNVYVGGSSRSSSGLTTIGAYQTTFVGTIMDGFVAKFNSAGTNLLWGSYFGGTNGDAVTSIAVDPAFNVYFTGNTSSSGLATAGTYQQVIGGNFDSYVGILNSNGSALIHFTYFGGGAYEGNSVIALDASNNVFIAGTTYSNYLATSLAHQPNLAGMSDAFVAAFSSNLDSLLACSYFGGVEEEENRSLKIDPSGIVYIAGSAKSTSGIATPGSYQLSCLDTFSQHPYVASFSCFFSTNGVEYFSPKTLFEVYPNPSDGHFTLSFNVNADFDVKVIDVNGRIVYETTDFSAQSGASREVELNCVESGVYLLQVQIASSVFSEKIIVVR